MKQTTHDIFLSYIPADGGSASVVERAMSAAGLRVFRAGEVRNGAEITEALSEALIESKAVVALITPLAARSSNIVLELGMAMSWRKPVYLLLDGAQPDELFAGARKFHVYPLSNLSAVVAAVKRQAEPLNEKERQRLVEVYMELQLPTDQLLINVAALDELSARFKESVGRDVSGERLASELLRLRKRGHLQRLRNSARSRQQSSKGAA